MLFEKQYDFTRSPIVENQVFFLESHCIRCGFVVLAPSIEELLQEEKNHRTACEVARTGS